MSEAPLTMMKARSNLSLTTPVWVRLVVVIGILIASLTLGYIGSSDQLQLVLLGIGGLFCVLVFLRWPTLGLFGVIASGMLIHYEGPGGVNVTIFLIIALLGLWVLDMVVIKNDVQVTVSRTFAPLYGLLLISFIGLGMGFLPWFTYVQPAPLDAQVGGFAAYALSYVIYILVANQVKSIRTLEWMVWAFLVIGSVFAFGILLPGLRPIMRTIFGNSGSIFWIWLVAIAYGQVLFNSDLSPKWRIVLGGVVIASVYILFSLKFKDKSGWVPILVVLWIITFLRSWRLGLAILLVGFLVGIPLIPPLLESEEYSLSTRIEILPIFWELIRANPVFGIGFANYHFYTELFSLRGWYTTFNSHNNYVDVAAQTGLLGLTLYILFFGKVGLLGWKLRKRVTGWFSKAYVNGMLGGLAGMISVSALGDWVLPFVYNIGLTGFKISIIGWFFLGGLVVLEQIFYPEAD